MNGGRYSDCGYELESERSGQCLERDARCPIFNLLQEFIRL